MKEKNKDKCLEVLRYWHKVEFFTPYDLDSAVSNSYSRYLSVSSHSLYSKNANQYLPWLSPLAKASANTEFGKEYNYVLYLLPFDKNQLTRLSKQAFPLSQTGVTTVEFEEHLADEGRTCFAKLSLDHKGRPDFDGMSLSTLPWALGCLTNNKLDELSFDAYLQSEKALQECVRKLAVHVDAESSDIIGDKASSGVITAKALQALMAVLQKWANFYLDDSLSFIVELRETVVESKLLTVTKPDSDEVQSALMLDEDEHETDDDDIESNQFDILNSFYIEDIERVINALKNGCASNVEKYLSGMSSNKRIDCFSDDNIESLISKSHFSKMNKGRWLRDDSHYMSFMQQLAINEVFSHQEDEFIFSVNGPPGTGKTTMLQDIISENIVKRASVLSCLTNPSDAFSGKKSISISNNKALIISILDDALCGFEMLVASSNNAAVENVSKELPLNCKLADLYQSNVSYLSPVAAKNSAVHMSGKVKPLAENNRPWGLVSAALGKSANRHRFSSRVFFSRDNDKEKALRLSRGECLTIWEWRKNYNGKSFEEAKIDFEKCKIKVDQCLDDFSQLETLSCDIENNCLPAIKLLCENLNGCKNKYRTALDKKKVLVNEIDILNARIVKKNNLLNQLDAFKPSLIERLLRLTTARLYAKKVSAIKNEILECLQNENKLDNKRALLDKRLQNCKVRIKDCKRSLQALIPEMKNKRNKLITLKERLNDVSMPCSHSEFYHKDVQVKAFWQSEGVNRLRSDLFASALKLHEAWLFSVMESKHFNANLIAISQLFQGGRIDNEHDEIYLWQSLFMWLPVVSSTFASIGRQFKNIGPRELGWLLIDEAGQATPQSAIGAIHRFRKVVSVGDPRQVEPVFTIPANLVGAMARQHFQDATYHQWLPSKTSVQELCDKANYLGASIKSSVDSLWVGCPLLIHRRCLDPMFSVANKIAYQNKMINARCYSNVSTFMLGGCQWFDIQGQANDKQYVEEQGQFIKKIFSQYVNEYYCLPDFFIITPFKKVKLKLQQLLANPNNWVAGINQGIEIPNKKMLNQWVRRHIGTVHAFQGREASVVLFVLGGDDSQKGALNWASSKPNLLNVAVTRARDFFYVVGDYDLWSQKKYFSDLASHIKSCESVVRCVT